MRLNKRLSMMLAVMLLMGSVNVQAKVTTDKSVGLPQVSSYKLMGEEEYQLYTFMDTNYLAATDFNKLLQLNTTTSGGLEVQCGAVVNYGNVGSDTILGLEVEGRMMYPLRALTRYFDIELNGKEITLRDKGYRSLSSIKTNKESIINSGNVDREVTVQITSRKEGEIAQRLYDIEVGANSSVELPKYEGDLIAVHVLDLKQGLDVVKAEIGYSDYMNEKFISLAETVNERSLEDKFPGFLVEYTVKYGGNAVKKGEIVKLVNNIDKTYAKVEKDNGQKVTVLRDQLKMNVRNRINKETATDQEIEDFINDKGYSSDTKYLVYVDMTRQDTYVMEQKEGGWKLVTRLLSSAGKNTTPTPLGTYKLTYKVPSFGENKGYKCKNAFGFIRTTYLFHSTVFDKTGSYLLEGKGVLGNQASDGCVRFSPEDAEWFYNTLISGSTVIIR